MEALLYILKSAVILSLFYVIYRVVLQKDTFFVANRHYLIAGILAALTFPFIEFTKTIYIDAPVVTDTIYSDEISILPLDTVTQQTFTVNWWYVGLTIYIIGIVIMVARIGIQLFSLRSLLKKYPTKRIGKYTYVTVSDNITPFSFFKTICYNPDLHTSSELKMILEHEKTHARQWHTLDVLLTQCILALQWMNPLAWLYKKSLEQNLEFLADSEAIQKIVSPKEYQHTLVKVSSTSLRPALTNNFYHSLIKKRIVMLNKQSSHKRNLWKLGLILPILVFFMYAFNVKTTVELLPPVDAIDVSTLPIENSIETLKKEDASNSSAILEDESTAFEKAIKTTPTLPQRSFSTRLASTSLKRAPIKKEEIGIMNERPPIKQNVVSHGNYHLQQTPNEFRFKITKNSTEEELLQIKKDLNEKHQVDFSYTAVRNEKNEIIALKVHYTTATNSNGNYNVSSDSPISDIYFYQEADGAIGLGNAKSSEEARALMEERLATRKIRLEERLKERADEREERLKEMVVRKEQLRSEMKERRAEARSEMRKHEHRVKERQHIMKERMKKREERLHERAKSAKGHAKKLHRSQHALEIKKNTTDEEIQEIKKKLEAKGISFSFSKVKRNSAGEITGYRMNFNDNNGTESSSKRKSSDSPMEPLYFTYDNNILRIHK